MGNAKTTQQVAAELHISRDKILKVVQRYPHLTPTRAGEANLFLWNTEQIQELQSHLANRKVGRPAK